MDGDLGEANDASDALLLDVFVSQVVRIEVVLVAVLVEVGAGDRG